MVGTGWGLQTALYPGPPPSRCLVHIVRSASLKYSKIRQFQEHFQFDVCRHEVRYGCLREDSCHFAHSFIELRVWLLQQYSGGGRAGAGRGARSCLRVDGPTEGSQGGTSGVPGAGTASGGGDCLWRSECFSGITGRKDGSSGTRQARRILGFSLSGCCQGEHRGEGRGRQSGAPASLATWVVVSKSCPLTEPPLTYL